MPCQLSQAARRYVGVRFRHRGRSKRALDCAGLGVISYADCGVELPDFRLYSEEPHDDDLIAKITLALGPPVAVYPVHRHRLRVDDVIVQRFEQEPHHVAILGSYVLSGLSMIHADGMAGHVVEHYLSDDHVARITHVFRRPV